MSKPIEWNEEKPTGEGNVTDCSAVENKTMENPYGFIHVMTPK